MCTVVDPIGGTCVQKRGHVEANELGRAALIEEDDSADQGHHSLKFKEGI